MKPRTSSPASVSAPLAWGLPGANGQGQIAAATECATEMFRGFEAMRKVQEQAAHAAAQRYANVTQRLKGRCGPEDILAVQTELLQFDVEGSTRYWQELSAAAMEMQTRMLGCLNHLATSEALLEAAATFDAATGRK